MAEKNSQDRTNHTRWDPAYHFFVIPVLLITVVGAIVQAVRFPGVITAWRVVFLVALAWVLISKPVGFAWNPLRWNWGKAAAVCATAFVLVWGGYFFHVSRLTMRDGTLIATFPNRQPIIKHLRTPVNFSIPIPAGEYLEGLRSLALHNHRGHQAFFMGEFSRKGGWKLYYPVVILLKWPTTVLVLFLTLLLLGLRRHFRVPVAFATA